MYGYNKRGENSIITQTNLSTSNPSRNSKHKDLLRSVSFRTNRNDTIKTNKIARRENRVPKFSDSFVCPLCSNRYQWSLDYLLNPTIYNLLLAAAVSASHQANYTNLRIGRAFTSSHSKKSSLCAVVTYPGIHLLPFRDVIGNFVLIGFVLSPVNLHEILSSLAGHLMRWS